MSQSNDGLRAEIGQAVIDEAAGLARVVAARALAAAMRDARQALWHAGYLVGPDRVTGSSPLGFGSDVTVGIATAFQIGGELVSRHSIATGGWQPLRRHGTGSPAR